MQEVDIPQLEFKKSTVREYFESIVVTAIIALFVTTFVVQAYKIPTGSMESNLLIGDHLLVNKFAYAPRLPGLARFLPYRDVHRNDIIVFKKPGDDVNPGNVLVKRAVAGPGDTVQVHDKELSVDGKPADGPYVQHIYPDLYRKTDPEASEMGLIRDQFGPFAVPAGHYFGMGDNRDNSLDSRFWGPIPRPNIFGRPFLIYWSYQAEPNSHVWRGAIAKIQQLASVAIHFFSRTRWDRMFTLVR